ncbi:retrotransposonlike family member (retr1)like [saccoglossus kowalevskii] [Plakobranchus ocellatus]|uniref:Retrotransposonlike family member (Retr1)like [saccoglossus kowalevskii] n=1 Tax=Plakobranchus ocellatus TaxID=259542 RepID=A0AAV4DYW1_9GAST|nr:retrotransposonlike family member (retr1)like [saccoglossus kowalevskii] [Plakobranchus ocellatus]
MGRKLKTKVPITQNQLLPHAVDHQTVRQREQKQKEDQMKSFDRRNAAKTLAQIERGEEVYIKDRKGMGK